MTRRPFLGWVLLAIASVTLVAPLPAVQVHPGVVGGGRASPDLGSATPSAHLSPAPVGGKLPPHPDSSAFARSPGDTWSPGLTSRGNGNATHPSARDEAQLAFNPDLGATILFGGLDPTGRALGDTWNFTNGTWSAWRGSAGPAPRWGGALAYDAADRYLVLFGGQDRASYFNDTWVFNRTGWHELFPAAAPSPRHLKAVAYDSTDDYLLLAGGSRQDPASGTSSVFNDTWTFRGGVWTNLSTSAGAAPYDPNVADDPVDGYVLGWGATGESIGEYFTFATGRWANHISSTTPSPADLTANGAWCGAGGFVLLFGSEQGSADRNLTWMFRGGVWSMLSLNDTSSPPARGGAGLAYDASRRQVVMFGGETVANSTFWSDTWLFNGVPFAVSIQAPHNPLDRDALATFRAAIVDPTGNFTYSFEYPSLPSGCTSANVTALACRPNATGDWRVTLVVVRSDRQSAAANFTLTIVPPPELHLSVSRTQTDPSVPISFAAASWNGTAPYTDTWSFGDGSTATGTIVVHAYLSAGGFTAHVTVTDAGLGSAAAAVNVTVASAVSAAVRSNLTTTDVGLPLSFSASVTGGSAPYRVSWVFGDGGQTNGSLVVHAFSSPGNYSAAATVTDALGTDFVTRTFVWVNPIPSIAARSNVTSTDLGVPVAFSAIATGGTGPLSTHWEFGDSTGSSGPTAPHMYSSVGTFVASVTIRDSLGLSSVARLAVNVSPTPTVGFSASTPGIDADRAVGFTSAIAGGVSPETVQWAFGDGTTGLGTAVTHQFVRPGNYTVTASVTDSIGVRESAQAVYAVASPLALAVSTAGTAGCVGNFTVRFQANVLSGSLPVSAIWDFGDGSPSSSGSVVSHEYRGTGPYTGSVTVRDAAGVSVTDQVAVSPIGCTPLGPVGSSPPWLIALLLASVGGAVAVGAALAVFQQRRDPPIPIWADEGSDVIPPDEFLDLGPEDVPGGR